MPGVGLKQRTKKRLRRLLRRFLLWLRMMVLWIPEKLPNDYFKDEWGNNSDKHDTWMEALSKEREARMASLSDSRHVSLGLLGAQAFILAALLLLFLAFPPLIWSLIPSLTAAVWRYNTPGSWLQGLPKDDYGHFLLLCKELNKRNHTHDQVKTLQVLSGLLTIFPAYVVAWALLRSLL